MKFALCLAAMITLLLPVDGPLTEPVAASAKYKVRRPARRLSQGIKSTIRRPENRSEHTTQEPPYQGCCDRRSLSSTPYLSAADRAGAAAKREENSAPRSAASRQGIKSTNPPAGKSERAHNAKSLPTRAVATAAR